jgi:hypothetical protein
LDSREQNFSCEKLQVRDFVVMYFSFIKNSLFYWFENEETIFFLNLDSLGT